MIKINNYEDMQGTPLSVDVESLVRHELQTLLELSGGKTIDPEYGHVMVLEEGDTDETVQAVLGCPFEQLMFEGVVYRSDCFIGYLSGGGNECVVVLICPEPYLTPVWKAKLIREV